MKIIEVSGNALGIGRDTGQALREEIRLHLELQPRKIEQKKWEQKLGRYLATLKNYLPLVLQEMQGIAQGAGVGVHDIFGLNLPLYSDDLEITQGCTNIVFADGPDGPVWGKNNDGLPHQVARHVCGRIVRRDDAVPAIMFAFCGMVSTADAMNAEGLAIGHSSVGSIFQQSDHYIPIHLWAYEGVLRCRTTQEFVRHMNSLPTRGKGYSMVCVDRNTTTCAIEAPCPLTQIRRPQTDHRNMYCVNCYQLPHLANADRRTPQDKADAQARAFLLDKKLSEDIKFDLEDMKAMLRHHGTPGICRHSQENSVTEYSMIALPQTGQVLYLEGLPCEHEYAQAKI